MSDQARVRAYQAERPVAVVGLVGPDGTAWWTVRDIAARTGTAVHTVQARRVRGALPFPDGRGGYRGRQLLWDPQRIEAWIARRTPQPGEVTAAELAVRLGVSANHIYRLTARRRLPAPTRRGRTACWAAAQVEAIVVAAEAKRACWTEAQAAEVVGLSRERMRQLRAQGTGPAASIRQSTARRERLWYRPADVRAWARARRAAP